MISVNCDWNHWTVYSPCNASCGNGWQTRTRSKKIVENANGECNGALTCKGNCTVVDSIDCLDDDNCPGMY